MEKEINKRCVKRADLFHAVKRAVKQQSKTRILNKIINTMKV